RTPGSFHQLVEIRPITPPGNIACFSGPEIGAQRFADVDYLVSDRDADAPLRITFAREHPEREVLDWKVGIGGVRGFDPRGEGRVVHLVHVSAALALRVRLASSSTGSRNEHESNALANFARDAS